MVQQLLQVLFWQHPSERDQGVPRLWATPMQMRQQRLDLSQLWRWVRETIHGRYDDRRSGRGITSKPLETSRTNRIKARDFRFRDKTSCWFQPDTLYTELTIASVSHDVGNQRISRSCLWTGLSSGQLLLPASPSVTFPPLTVRAMRWAFSRFRWKPATTETESPLVAGQMFRIVPSKWLFDDSQTGTKLQPTT